MIDSVAANLALRNRALSLVVCTTGSATLAATATTYTRASGSFVTDGFAVGMDVVASGFTTPANNTNGVVAAVAATVLTVTPYAVSVSAGVQNVTHPVTVIEAASAGRTIAAKLPSMRAWDNTAPVGLTAFVPATGIPYVAEEYTPATTQLVGQRSGGDVWETGLYVIQWYGLTGSGITALRRSVDALRLLYAPGTAFSIGSNTLRVRTDTAPVAGEIIEDTNGFAVLEMKVYWFAESINVIAA